MIVAYTDGACVGNPGPGGWAAIIVADGTRQEISGAAPDTTNNRMELTAAIEALRRVPAASPVRIVTDSEYLIKGMTQWLPAWRRRGWRTATGQPVLNRDLWETLDALAGNRVSWEWVRGHSGHPENERADALARAQSWGSPLLPRAPAGSPTEEPRCPPAARPSRGTSSASRPHGQALPPVARDTVSPPGRSPESSSRWPTYLSLVDGELMRHPDWPACQARTHGKARARFKKCRSAEEERATVAAWGLPPEVLAALD